MRRALSVLLLVTAWSTGAVAQGPSDTPASPQATKESHTDAERARDLGHAGLDAYGQGDYPRALDLFQRAEALAHSPVFRLYAARCLLGLGQVDEARAELEAVLNTTPTEGAPEAWLRARQAAGDELAALPTATSEAPGDADSTFDADGRVVRVASAEMPPPDSHPEPAAKRSFWARATPQKKGALVAFGVGALGLVFTAVTGGIAIAESMAIKANCVDSVCPAEDLPRAEYATQMANLATVGAGVVVAGGVTGGVLWALPQRNVTVTVAGPGLRLEGRF